MVRLLIEIVRLIAVLQGLGIDVNVHHGAGEGRPRELHGHAHIADRHDAALLLQFVEDLDQLQRRFHHGQGDPAGAREVLLQHRVFLPALLLRIRRQTVGFRQRREHDGVLVRQPQEIRAELLKLLHVGPHFLLHAGVLLLSHGQVPDHESQGAPQSPRQGRGSPASRDRLSGGQHLQILFDDLLFRHSVCSPFLTEPTAVFAVPPSFSGSCPGRLRPG